MKIFEENIKMTGIDIYLKYSKLDVADIVELLSKLDNLYQRVLDNSFPVYYSEKFESAFRNFLEVESINTGQSVRFKFKEGWKPEFKITKKKELEIGIPLKLGIPVFILYVLLFSAQKTVEIRDKYLDDQLKELEIKIKKLELHEKIENNNRKRPIRMSYQRQADEIIEFIKYNNNFFFVEINSVVVKDNKIEENN